MGKQLLRQYEDLANSNSDEDAQAVDPAAAAGASMSDLDSAVGLCGKPAKGTLATAWKACPLLDFEGNLPENEEVLKAATKDPMLTKSDDPEVILSNLLRWRNKWLTAVKKGLPQQDLKTYREGVEALRYKAYLLYLQENAKKVFGNMSSRVSAAGCCQRG